MASRIKPSEMVAEVQRLQDQVSLLADSVERIIERLDRLETRGTSKDAER